MICPKCHADQQEGAPECGHCGVIFGKAKPPPDIVPCATSDDPAPGASALEVFLPTQTEVQPFYVVGRALLYVGLLVWSWHFIAAPLETNYAGESFLHNINLPFHEAGHIVFRPLGRFLTVLGGTLGQLLMPLICVYAFLFHTRDAFGASVALWWVAENFMDIAPYVNDARDLELILLGGVTGKDVEDYHDWQNILTTLGWLPYDHRIAHAVQQLGIVLMLVALIWGGAVLYRQFTTLRNPKISDGLNAS